MTTKRVGIVILNLNGIDDTLECLESVQSQKYRDYKILLIDNGSKNNSVKILKKYQSNHKENTELVILPKNIGFTGGVNTGIEWALKNGFDYVALVNNDLILDKNWLGILVGASDEPEVGICTGLLLHRDGKTIDSTGDWYSIWGLPFPRNRNENTEKAAKDGFVFSASGGASLYKTSLLKEIGMFDQDFFAYYEDTDISFRAQLAGYKVKYSKTAVAYHKQGETSKKMPGFAVYQTFKNLPLLFIKNVPRGLLFKIGVRFYFAYLMIYLNAIKNGSGIPATKGLAKGFLLFFKKLGERRHIQANKKVASSYINGMLWQDMPPDQTGLRKLRKLFTGKV
jgi:GT2 family glycosyltransferase